VLQTAMLLVCPSNMMPLHMCMLCCIGAVKSSTVHLASSAVLCQAVPDPSAEGNLHMCTAAACRLAGPAQQGRYPGSYLGL
jgi:hypothetical protein